MRFRASNLVLLFAIVLAIAAAILFTGRAQREASDLSSKDEAASSAVLEAWLSQVLGLGYIYTGDESTIAVYTDAGKRVDEAISELRSVTADASQAEVDAAAAEVAAVRNFQELSEDAFSARRAGEDASVQMELGMGVAINGVIASNREFGVAVEKTRKDRQSRANQISIGAVALLGLLIMALGFTARRDDRRRRARRDFGEALQTARTESEAYELVRNHLEKAVKGSEVAVFNRNDSADRLEASTTLAEGSPLGVALRGAKPSDCLAVRSARQSRGGEASDGVLRCDICGRLSGGSVCVPSIVGGEVIGSVLVRRQRAPGEGARRLIAEGVAAAAPVVAHLRSLAVAERRAGSDHLTGLPNKRAAEDRITHMVADAARTGATLGMLVFDLDHFKRVNDTFGHPKGDEVLAAVGAVTADHIRGADFAARFGGEEFLVLLPGSSREQARVAAEKLRRAIAELKVPGINRPITASFGVAALPGDADGRDELVRTADRALYAAKRGGRNRVEVPDPHSDNGSIGSAPLSTPA
jgi:diguanylate cyclase (GGDEF)-like protein